MEAAERWRLGLLFSGGLAALAAIIAVLSFQSIGELATAVWAGANAVPVNGGAFMMPFPAVVMAGWAVWGFLSIRGPQPKIETLMMRVSADDARIGCRAVDGPARPACGRRLGGRRLAGKRLSALPGSAGRAFLDHDLGP